MIFVYYYYMKLSQYKEILKKQRELKFKQDLEKLEEKKKKKWIKDNNLSYGVPCREATLKLDEEILSNE
jgi:hypothetical protein